MGEFTKVAAETDVPQGQLRRVMVDGQPVLLANVGGTVYATQAACTHDEGPLDEGELEDDCIRCPWHFSLFSLKTGEVIESPAADGIATYEVQVEDGQILILTG